MTLLSVPPLSTPEAELPPVWSHADEELSVAGGDLFRARHPRQLAGVAVRRLGGIRSSRSGRSLLYRGCAGAAGLAAAASRSCLDDAARLRGRACLLGDR